jgi:hypothetical protein
MFDWHLQNSLLALSSDKYFPPFPLRSVLLAFFSVLRRSHADVLIEASRGHAYRLVTCIYTFDKVLRVDWNAKNFDRIFLNFFAPPLKKCTKNVLLLFMGSWVEGQACADPGAPTPISASKDLYAYCCNNITIHSNLRFVSTLTPLNPWTRTNNFGRIQNGGTQLSRIKKRRPF